MRFRAAILCAAALGLATASGSGAAADEPAALVAFVSPSGGAEAAAVEEIRAGFVAGLGGPTPVVRDFALPAAGKVADLAAVWKKTPPDVIVAWCPDGRTRELEAFAEKAKTPLVVVSPEETRPSADPARPVFWTGGIRTPDEALQAIGLATGGYESALESQILDDLMGRFISRMNRLYRRNPDGSAIPGVSWNVSFTTDPPGKDVKSSKKFAILLAGDDPATGGRAAGPQAWIYTTFLQRTLYADHALTPPIAASDRVYLSGRYKWGTSVDENLRGDRVRALVDGYTQAMALTGAHEVGHICGPDHDTESPRSIMNVVDAVGLEFEWADWIPAHEKMLDRALGRAPAPKD